MRRRTGRRSPTNWKAKSHDDVLAEAMGLKALKNGKPKIAPRERNQKENTISQWQGNKQDFQPGKSTLEKR